MIQGIVADYIRKYINVRFGLIGALIMGGIVFYINVDHGWWPASTAALKQAAYTFFLGGAIIRLLEFMLQKTEGTAIGVILSILTVTVVTSMLVYILHSMKGTPEPFLSTVPTLIMAPGGFTVLAIKFKKDQRASGI